MIFSFHQQVFVLLSFVSLIQNVGAATTPPTTTATATTATSASSTSKNKKKNDHDLLRGSTNPATTTANDDDDCLDDEIKYLTGSSDTYPYKEPPIKILHHSSTSSTSSSSNNNDEVTFYIQNTLSHDHNVDISVGFASAAATSSSSSDGSKKEEEKEICYNFDNVKPHEVVTSQPITASCLTTSSSALPMMSSYAIVDILLDGSDGNIDQDSDILRDFKKYSSSVCWDGVHKAPKKLYSFKVPCGGCGSTELEGRQRSLQDPSLILNGPIRSIDGTGEANGKAQVGVELLRLSPVVYTDGVGLMKMEPNARMISKAVSTNVDGNVPNLKDASDMLWLWGQFIDHDLDLTHGGAEQQVNIVAPTCPTSEPLCMVPFDRSGFSGGTTNPDIPRQHHNDITGCLDGSGVYGSDSARADYLREWFGGRMKTTDGNLLPFGVAGTENAFPGGSNPGDFYLAGDIRANENLGLLSMHTLFMREHNRVAGILEVAYPGSTDENLYQMARKIVGATIQRITYNEFLPVLVGTTGGYDFQGMLSTYDPNTSYDATMNPAIATEFSTVAFRVGHTMLSSAFPGMPNGTFLRDVFFQTKDILTPHVMTSILGGFATVQAQEVDTKVIQDVQDMLFGAPVSQIGQDLAARNIQRARDHGIGTYNQVRAGLGMGTKSSFAEITSNPTTQAELRAAYGTKDNGDDNVDAVDAWVGGLAEDHNMGDAMVGELFYHIICDQFYRLMYGDDMFYLNDPDLISNWSKLQDNGIDLSTVTLRDVMVNNLEGIYIDTNSSVMKMGAVVAIQYPRNGDGGPPNTQCYPANDARKM